MRRSTSTKPTMEKHLIDVFSDKMHHRKTINIIFLLALFLFPIISFADDISGTMEISAIVPDTGQSLQNDKVTLKQNSRPPINNVRTPVSPSISFSGKTSPGAIIGILKNGVLVASTKASDKALFSVNIPNLNPGNFTFTILYEDGAGKAGESVSKSLVINDGALTTISGIYLPPGTPNALPAPADINHDNHVNIADFSIMAFWYKKTIPAPSVDLNHDGKVTLVDFSILASKWSG